MIVGEPRRRDHGLSIALKNAALVAGLFIPAAMAVLIVLAPHDPIRPALITWVLGVLPMTLLQRRKPLYPFSTWEGRPTRTLTPAQGRVLAFLKSRSNRWLALWVSGITGGLIPLSAWLGCHLRVHYAPLADYTSWTLRAQALVSLGAGLAGAALLTLGLAYAHLGASAWYSLRRWEWIQQRYEPWPLRGLRADFLSLEWHDHLKGVRYAEPGVSMEGIRWRQWVAVGCGIVGMVGLTSSTAHIISVVLDPRRYGYPPGAATRMLIVPLLFLGILGLARYLARRR